MTTRAGWREAMVVFHDAPDAPRPAGRAARRAQTRATTEKRRSDLIAQLADAGLSDEAEVREAGALPSLLVQGTPRALRHLKETPAVRDVYELSPDAGMKPL